MAFRLANHSESVVDLSVGDDESGLAEVGVKAFEKFDGRLIVAGLYPSFMKLFATSFTGATNVVVNVDCTAASTSWKSMLCPSTAQYKFFRGPALEFAIVRRMMHVCFVSNNYFCLYT
jgi:hypothetical protein